MHGFKEPDKEKLLQYFRWFTHFIRGCINILDKVFYSDEACVHLSGYVNSQNSRIWSAENPHTFHERPLYSLKVGVWCAVSRRRIIGPVFFNETVTADRYQELIMNFISPLEVDEQDCWFQQDGATSHTANSTMQMLSEFFGGCIISRNFWPPRSPDLSPSDLYLWVFLKENMYKNNAHTQEELKQNIELCISNVTAETHHRVESDVREKEGMHALLKAVDISNT
jgi:hypothetical protein